MVGGIPIVVTQENLDELAVRNGGPVSVNREGQVIMQDDFSNGIEGWNKTETAGTVTWSSARHVPSSGFCCAMAVTGAAGVEIARRDPALHQNVEGAPGLEFDLMWPVANDLRFMVEFSQFRLTNWINAIMIISQIGNITLVVNNINVAIQANRFAVNSWHKIKLVVDFIQRSYLTLYVDEQATVISQNALTIVAAGGGTDANDIMTTIGCSPAVGGATGTCYVGQVIQTIGDS